MHVSRLNVVRHPFLDTSEEILYNGVLLRGRCFAGGKHYVSFLVCFDVVVFDVETSSILLQCKEWKAGIEYQCKGNIKCKIYN